MFNLNILGYVPYWNEKLNTSLVTRKGTFSDQEFRNFLWLNIALETSWSYRWLWVGGRRSPCCRWDVCVASLMVLLMPCCPAAADAVTRGSDNGIALTLGSEFLITQRWLQHQLASCNMSLTSLQTRFNPSTTEFLYLPTGNGTDQFHLGLLVLTKSYIFLYRLIRGLIVLYI